MNGASAPNYRAHYVLVFALQGLFLVMQGFGILGVGSSSRSNANLVLSSIICIAGPIMIFTLRAPDARVDKAGLGALIALGVVGLLMVRYDALLSPGVSVGVPAVVAVVLAVLSIFSARDGPRR